MNKLRRLFKFATSLLSLAVLSYLLGCNKPASVPSAPKIIVAKPVQKRIGDVVEMSARLDAVEKVDLRSRVSGYITQVMYKEGIFVHQGDFLFAIDSRLNEASVEQAKSQLAEAEAAQLIESTAHQRNKANQAVAEAHVRAAQALLELARVNLDFTQIKAPISGRISAQKLTVGNLVEPSQILAELVSVDPIYAYFTIDESELWRIQRKSGEPKSEEKVPVTLLVGGEEPIVRQGSVDFVDFRVNATNGTLTIRGVFPNADGVLIPGESAHVRIAIKSPYV